MNKLFSTLFKIGKKAFARHSPSPATRRASLGVEALEERSLMSVTSAVLSGGMIYVNTDNRDSNACVKESGGNILVVDFTNNFRRTFAPSQVKRVQFVGGAGNDTFSDSVSWLPLQAWGYGGNDRLTGAGAADILCGGDGNDTLVGGNGNDRLYGGAGDDTFYGGPGFNTYNDVFSPTAWAWNGYQATDIYQGKAGTCSIDAGLAAAVGKVNFSSNIQYLGNCLYQIRLWKNGRPDYQKVFFDGTWNDNDCKPTIVRDSNGNDTGRVQGEFWTVLYQRAYLQQQGVNYNDPDWNHWDRSFTNMAKVMHAISGWTFSQPGHNAAALQVALQKQNCLAAVDRADVSHAYAIRNVYQTGGQWYVQLYNPWGYDNTNISGMSFLNDGVNDGLITVTWSTFVRNFPYLYKTAYS
jgi:hypothetical protein